MDRHEFLSPEWVAAARRLRDEVTVDAPPPPIAVRINVVVTDTPFEADPLLGHVDTTAGQLFIDEGHLDGADLTLTLAHQLAKSLFIDRDVQAFMQAFLKGQIRAEGDVMRLLAVAPSPTAEIDPDVVEAYRRMRDFTL